MSTTISARIAPVSAELRQLAGIVEELGEQAQWSPELVFQIQLVLDEIGDNIIEHGQNSGAGAMEVTLTADEKTVVVEIADDGQPFDPLQEAPEPDLTSDLADRPVGGLGLHIVRTIMDDLQYHRDQGKNRLVLTKRIDS